MGALAELAPNTFAACDRSQHETNFSREHALWDSINLHCPSIDRPCRYQAFGAPESRVRAQGSLNATTSLVYSAQAATTLIDCIATYNWRYVHKYIDSRFVEWLPNSIKVIIWKHHRRNIIIDLNFMMKP